MALDVASIEVVGLDLDQTLYTKSPEIDNLIQAHIYEAISDSLGCSVEKAKQLFNDLYQKGSGLSGSATLAALNVPNGSQVVQEALESADLSDYLVPNRETIELIERLGVRYRGIDLLTGSNRENTERKLGKLAIPIDAFGVIITADDAKKSTGEAFEKWASAYPDLQYSNFLYVGDRVSTDHAVPSRLGMQTVLVNVSEVDQNIDCVQLATLHELGELVLSIAND